MNKAKTYKNSKDEWYTPKSVINYVNSIEKITLDPSTTEKNAKRMRISKFYTKETNGLDKDWSNEVVWLNPPFSEKEKWVEKCIYEINNNECKKVFLLLPMNFETKLFQKIFKEFPDANIHIPNKRINFIDGNKQLKGVPFGSCIVELEKYWFSLLPQQITIKTFNLKGEKNEQ